jgi:ribosome biogenesis GTPase
MRESPSPSRLARVVTVGRNAAWISFEDEGDRLRLAALRKTLDRQRLAPGDLVTATPLDEERVVVERREPRTFALERTTVRGRTKTMAANVDTLAIVAAFERPPLHLAMLDELLAFAELHELAAALILTKPDLIAPELAEEAPALYRSLGYPVAVVNSKQERGVDEAARLLDGRRAILIGQSGVGKSSLFAALGGSAEVGDVSKIGRGRQTTTTGRLHRFPSGWVIDSPGVGEFELHGIARNAVADGFVEFRPLTGSCRFTDCSHRTEPGCAIRSAVSAGAVAASRYASYLAILERPPEDEAWERSPDRAPPGSRSTGSVDGAQDL